MHIPKVAGQSIESFFLNLHNLDWASREALLLRPNDDPEAGPQRLAHLKAHEYVDCGHINQVAFNQYFKFSFVRNPWARLVSEYRYRKYSEKYSFTEFVLRGLPKKNLFTDAYRHIIPQCEYLQNSDGEFIVDFIGKFENLQSDFDRVCKKLDITKSTLPHRNSSENKHASTKKHFTEYYDNQTRDIVAELYRKDIDLFGYEFK